MLFTKTFSFKIMLFKNNFFFKTMLSRKHLFFKILLFNNEPKTQISFFLRGEMNQNVSFCLQSFFEKSALQMYFFLQNRAF